MIKDKGAIAMARALETNAVLETIKMGNNQISNEGAVELSKRLASNKTLKKLTLGMVRCQVDHNPIQESAVLELMKLQRATSIAVKLDGLFSK